MTVLNKHHFGGRVPPHAVNIMRGSPFGNPFVMGRDGDRAAVVEKFRHWLWGRLNASPNFAAQVAELHGKDLCCCCAPLACHGDVLEAAAAWLVSQTAAGSLPAKETV